MNGQSMKQSHSLLLYDSIYIPQDKKSMCNNTVNWHDHLVMYNSIVCDRWKRFLFGENVKLSTGQYCAADDMMHFNKIVAFYEF